MTIGSGMPAKRHRGTLAEFPAFPPRSYVDPCDRGKRQHGPALQRPLHVPAQFRALPDGETVVTRHGKVDFRASAAEPVSAVDPVAMDVPQQAGYETADLRPEHWCEFIQPDAPVFDFVLTLSATASRWRLLTPAEPGD